MGITLKNKNMKKKFLLISFLVLTSCATNKSHKINNTKHTKKSDNIELAKKYVFIKCLMYSYDNNLRDSIINKDMSLSMIWDIGDSIPFIHKNLDSLSMDYAKSIKITQIKDYNQKKPILYKCLNYYKSKKTDSIIKNLIIKYRH